METKIYNIDSINRNKSSYPSSSNFTYTVESTVQNNNGTINMINPFNEKNVIEMKILSIEIPNTVYFISSTRGNNTFSINGNDIIIFDGSYTLAQLMSVLNNNTTNLSISLTFSLGSANNKTNVTNTSGATHTINFPPNTTSYQSFGQILGFNNTSYTITSNAVITSENACTIPVESYFFLRLNNLGDIINNNKNCVAKIVADTSKQYTTNVLNTTYNFITNNIKFHQPEDIQNLDIRLEDYMGNIVSLNGCNFSFTMELVIVNNSILKNYEQIKFYSEPVMERILQAKMLAYYEKQVDNNNTLTGNYNSNLVNMNNSIEYTANGIKNNYSNISSSYFTNMK